MIIVGVACEVFFFSLLDNNLVLRFFSFTNQGDELFKANFKCYTSVPFMVKALFPERSGLSSVLLSLLMLSCCLSVWVDNSSLMNWAALTIWASPLSLAVRCGCGLLQSVEILSVCTANQRSACSRDVVLLSRQPPTLFSEFWSLVSTPCLFHYLHSACFYHRCVLSAVWFLFNWAWAYSDYSNRTSLSPQIGPK